MSLRSWAAASATFCSKVALSWPQTHFSRSSAANFVFLFFPLNLSLSKAAACLCRFFRTGNWAISSMAGYPNWELWFVNSHFSFIYDSVRAHSAILWPKCAPWTASLRRFGKPMKKAHFVDSILTIWALIFAVLLLFGFRRLAFIVNQCRSVSRHAYIIVWEKCALNLFNCFHSFRGRMDWWLRLGSSQRSQSSMCLSHLKRWRSLRRQWRPWKQWSLRRKNHPKSDGD